MKPKAYLACLLVLFILLTALTACAKPGDQEESQPTRETSPSTSRTQVTTKETEPSPVETETGPSQSQESDPSESAEAHPSREATSAATSTSSTTSTMTLPSYTITMTTDGASFTFPSLTWTSPPTNLSKEYERIYNDYANRLKKATPRLIDEYKSEIKTNPDLDGVREKKVADLSAILEEGTAKMDKLYQDKDGELSELGEWVGKLSAVYAEELVKLGWGIR